MDSLEIIRSAPAMQIQDLGRYGVAHQGLSQGGALDLHAHSWANHLLGNPIDCPTLEILIGNTEIIALRDSNISLTGAEMSATIDGEMLRNWSSFMLLKGQRLKLSYASSGLRSYLGIQGGFTAEALLGSVATVLRNGIGSNLADNAILKSSLTDLTFQHRLVPSKFIPSYDDEITLRVITADASDLRGRTFTVSANSDRTGIRLDTDSPLPAGSGITSEPNALGAIRSVWKTRLDFLAKTYVIDL